MKYIFKLHNFIKSNFSSKKFFVISRITSLIVIMLSFYFNYKLIIDIVDNNIITIAFSLILVLGELQLFWLFVESIRNKNIIHISWTVVLFTSVFFLNTSASASFFDNFNNLQINENTNNKKINNIILSEKETKINVLNAIADEIKNNKEIEVSNKDIENNIKVVSQNKILENEEKKLYEIKNKLKPLMVDSQIDFSDEVIKQKNIIIKEEKKLYEIKNEVKNELEKKISDNNVSGESINKVLDIIKTENSNNIEKNTSYIIHNEKTIKGFNAFLDNISKIFDKNESSSNRFKSLFSFIIGNIIEILGLILAIITPEDIRKKYNIIEKINNIKGIKKLKLKKEFLLNEYLQTREKEECKLSDLCVDIKNKYNYEIKPNILGKELKKLGIEKIKDSKGSPIFYI